MSSLLQRLDHQPVELNFGTSGLRGLASDMTDLECYINTIGFIDFLKAARLMKDGDSVGLGGDLRDSTRRIMKAVAQGLLVSRCKIINLGLLPTPALALWGIKHSCPVAMVTGSHIPADRNGIKFYKPGREVMKPDEALIKVAVGKVRQKIYTQAAQQSLFDHAGRLKKAPSLPTVKNEAIKDYLNRYLEALPKRFLAGKQIVVYQHSSIARDLLVEVLEGLAAKVTAVDRADQFIPIDTENVTAANRAYFKKLAKKYPDNFAIVSADGDADRPFVIDEVGTFHRGDVLGAVTAAALKAQGVAITASTSDAIDDYLSGFGVSIERTKIGSPYVIAGMEKLITRDLKPVVGWEVNGGFLTETATDFGAGQLSPLPTRDAFLPILAALFLAASQKIKISEVFGDLPQRFTQAGLIDNFPVELSSQLVATLGADTLKNRETLSRFFITSGGFSEIVEIDGLDGVRLKFSNGDVAHIRPSNNAPQLRIYSTADSQARADQIVDLALAEPNGILRRLAASL